MSENPKFFFQIGETEDGRFVAASSREPIFCFLANTEDAVIDQAQRAIRFFLSDDGEYFEAPRSQTKRVISFVPQRRVEAEREAA